MILAVASGADTKLPSWVPLVILGVAALVYANALPNGFVLDDRAIVLGHPLVREPLTSWRAFLQPYWPAEVGGGQYRPLGIMSLALDRAIAGDRAAWFHFVNIGWHAVASVLLLRVAQLVVGATGAVAAALVFAVHPVHVEAVANIVGRLELMGTAFGLATLLLHRRGSRLAPAAFAAALFSKEIAIVVPLLALLMDRLVPAAPRDGRRGLYVAYVAVAIVWVVALVHALGGSPWSVRTAVHQDLDHPERLLTVLTVVPHYVRLLVAPFALSADYEPAVISPADSFNMAAGVGFAVLAGSVVGAWWAWRRQPVLAFAILWTAVALAPVSNITVVTGVALAERTLYLASAGLALAVGWVVTHTSSSPRVTQGVVALTLLAFAARTWTRTPVWRDSRTLAVRLLEDHPESYRAHWVVGRVLRARGDLPGAEREFALARELYAHDVSLLRESAQVATSLGRPAAAKKLGQRADSIAAARAR